jgi:hypothetical protein
MSLQSELMRGVLDAAELRGRLGVSPASLMRMVRQAGSSVVRIGRARATRYGWRQAWPGLEDTRFPIIRISPEAVAQPAGELITLAARQTVWLPEGRVADGLPVELADARPSGFLGRHFATQHADLRLPDRLDVWSDHHILLALSRRGEDLPGDLILGDESFARWQALTPASSTRADYPALARAAMAGHPPGSSAGGDRPKFGAFVDGRHVLVKFTSCGSAGDLVARRWCDLLVLEALALEVAREHGAATAGTELIETDSHWFLESRRFDRVGARGRVAVVSLAAVHDDAADSWARAAMVLREQGRIGAEDAAALCWLDAYGALIGNTDRHQFNIVFFLEGDRLRLAPAFDQSPACYAPAADGQALLCDFVPPFATADTLAVWDRARRAAREFWARAADDGRVSGDLRSAAASNAGALA